MGTSKVVSYFLKHHPKAISPPPKPPVANN